VLFELISARYERRSMLITANQPFGEWNKVFPDPAMTLAAVDRLVHHAIIFEMNVESYRRRQAIARKRAQDARRPRRHSPILPTQISLIDAPRQSTSKTSCARQSTPRILEQPRHQILIQFDARHSSRSSRYSFIKERQREDIQKAKAEGVYKGGQRRLERPKIIAMHEQGEEPAVIAKALNCSRMQVYRIVREHEDTLPKSLTPD
jgi:hypothetical protein